MVLKSNQVKFYDSLHMLHTYVYTRPCDTPFSTYLNQTQFDVVTVNNSSKTWQILRAAFNNNSFV